MKACVVLEKNNSIHEFKQDIDQISTPIFGDRPLLFSSNATSM